MSRFVFLDRDGTLVEDRGYVHRLEDYRLLPGVADALRRLADAGYRLGIVTNQSGIGRGYFTRDDFDRFHAHLLDDLARQGVKIDGTWLCPHAPAEGCGCRKPAPGLLYQARDAAGAELAQCWMIGDGARDAEAARAAGCAGAVWIAPPSEAVPDDVGHAADLAEAAAQVLAGAPRFRRE